MVLLTAAANAAPSHLLFRACNDLFECWEVTRFYPAEGHLSRFTNRAEGIITTLTSQTFRGRHETFTPAHGRCRTAYQAAPRSVIVCSPGRDSCQNAGAIPRPALDL